MRAARRRPTLSYRGGLVLLLAASALATGRPVFAEPSAPAVPASAPVVLRTHDPAARDRVSMTIVAAPPAVAAGEVAVGEEREPRRDKALHVRGLRGTLNKDDVHQTMEARQAYFDRCVGKSRRTLRWVSGSIRFGFVVDAAGRVVRARALESTLGHRPLELCLTQALLQTQFPKPAGRARARFEWGMSIDPVRAHPLELDRSKVLAKRARKQARVLHRACELPRRRVRFRLTLYVGPRGRLLSAGGVALTERGADKLDCVLEQVSKWHLPKLKRMSKLSFDVR